jgi:hypothetical protein
VYSASSYATPGCTRAGSRGGNHQLHGASVKLVRRGGRAIKIAGACPALKAVGNANAFSLSGNPKTSRNPKTRRIIPV